MTPYQAHSGADSAPERTADEPSEADLSLHSLVGVTRRAHLDFQQECRRQLKRISAAADLIMQRGLRRDASALSETLQAVVSRCESEPDDIRQEIALPSVLKRVAGALEDYLDIVSQGNAHPAVQARLKEIEAMTAQAVPWLKELLERMQSMEGQDTAVRARVLSRIFQLSRAGDFNTKEDQT